MEVVRGSCNFPRGKNGGGVVAGRQCCIGAKPHLGVSEAMPSRILGVLAVVSECECHAFLLQCT